LKKHFPIQRGLFRRTVGYIRAVDGVNLAVGNGETLGIVGESGSGKTTVARIAAGLIQATEGHAVFRGGGREVDMTMAGAQEKKTAWRDLQMIFQDPFSSLNPRLPILETVGEPLIIHDAMSGRALHERVVELLERVGLPPTLANCYPHELSGGQKQRVGLARAMALDPELIICDEAVSALDVSVQSQILNLLLELQKEGGLSYLFIAHNLSVVGFMSDRIAVMYLGRVVETASTTKLFERPLHPYTEALLFNDPVPDPRAAGKRRVLKGEVPSPANPPSGCAFHPRCPHATERCRAEIPHLEKAGPEHWTACLRWQEISLEGRP
jgi:oligopeptide/dipeptide ABC transporter ATP-binding protein